MYHNISIEQAMTQEDKDLLLKDLCGRLPYGVTVNNPLTGDEDVLTYSLLEDFEFVNSDHPKPYLRPMSSMTEEEIKELKTLCSIYIPTDSPTIGFEDYGIVVFTHHLTNNTYSFKLNISVIDWLNSHHFDYRGLIGKGLAIEVTEDNNPYKE